MALAAQEVKAYAALLAIDTDNQRHIMRKLAAAASGADTFGEVKADLCLWIIA